MNSLRTALKANKLVKPHPSPLPPPPQSFSDSPRKRRGRGYLSSTSTAVGQAAGTNGKRNETIQKRPGPQNKYINTNTSGSFTNNTQTTQHDDALQTLAESMPSNSDITSEKVDSEKIKFKTTDDATNKIPDRVGSIVSVETKFLVKKGDCKTSSAAV